MAFAAQGTQTNVKDVTIDQNGDLVVEYQGQHENSVIATDLIAGKAPDTNTKTDVTIEADTNASGSISIGWEIKQAEWEKANNKFGEATVVNQGSITGIASTTYVDKKIESITGDFVTADTDKHLVDAKLDGNNLNLYVGSTTGGNTLAGSVDLSKYENKLTGVEFNEEGKLVIKDKDGNEYTQKDTTLSEKDSLQVKREDGYGSTAYIKDTAGNQVTIEDIASAEKLAEVDGQVQTNEDNINDNKEAIDQEIQDRRDADDRLDTKIDDETERAQGEEQRIEQKFDKEISNLNTRVERLDDKVDKVGAMAAAIANLHTMGYDPAAPTEIAVGVGQYRDKTGLAIGAFHYPNRDFMVNFSISTAGDEFMGGVGAIWKLGRKTPEQLLQAEKEKAARAKLAKELAAKEAAEVLRVEAQQKKHLQMLSAK